MWREMRMWHEMKRGGEIRMAPADGRTVGEAPDSLQTNGTAVGIARSSQRAVKNALAASIESTGSVAASRERSACGRTPLAPWITAHVRALLC